MKKRWLIAGLSFCITLTVSSQTLFTYGKYKADAADFLRAYNKNNALPVKNKEKAVRDYLDLYIHSRLKIQEAYARGYDTLAQIKGEVDNLRAQIMENYMSDPEAINRLTKEAFQRSQKDIHVEHLFISFINTAGIMDTLAARKKLNEVLARLNKKEDFQNVVAGFSDDPSAKVNKGDIGYITAFTLPYAFENIIYTTPSGKISSPLTSKAGYHLFRNKGERKALGKIKVQQILLAFPPGADDATKKNTSRLADSLYSRIMAGDDFGSLASQFSNDYISAATGGNVPDISVGQYDMDFEKVLWALPKDGAVSKPFLTSHGYHIVKRVSLKPVIADPNDKANQEDLKQKVMYDDRWKTAKDFIYDRVKKKPGVRKALYSDAVLWALSDSLLEHKPAGIGKAMNYQSPLLTIGDTTITVFNWIAYAQAYRYKPDRSGLKTYPDLMDEFTKYAMYEYYRAHLEDYSDEFRIQMQEFRDGNLFFEIMQREIWNKTQSDSAALMKVYEKNKAKYNWQPSADAVIFFCSDAGTCKALYEELKKNPSAWKKATDPLVEKVVADSARYEWAQLPGLDKSIPKAGMLTPSAVNPADNTASFAYIIKVYTEPTPRTFNEAKGLVMNDYQASLEEEWIKELKKKYPVVIDQKVLSKISK
ncbi:MAG: peptidylprolyl isomerase [Chitinophagaceae bacterium]|nr:peptidylprolyl isomerase [Chitinophagaceae bacterium]